MNSSENKDKIAGNFGLNSIITMQNILESISDAFVALDRNWCYTYVNRKAAEIFNRKYGELEGKHIWTEFPEGIGQPFYHNYYKAVEDQKMIEMEEYYPPYDKWFENRIYPSPEGLSIFFRDVTDRKKAELELRKAKEEAEIMSRMKSVFLANMSHELRTPLMGILGCTEILKNSLPDNELGELARKIEISGSRLNETLGSIYDLSMIETNEIQITRSRVDIAAMLGSVIELFMPAIREKGLSIKVESSNTELKVFIDERLLRQVVINIANNAVKYTSEGGILIEYGLETGVPELFYIRVNDTGKGILPEKQTVIFDEFRQESEGLSRSFQGAGLGLTICKKFTEMMNGKISVTSQPGKGSCFTIKFPFINETETGEDYSAKEAALTENKNSGRRPKILYVEDDAINRSVVQLFLKKDYILDTATNGMDALELTMKNKYDAVLMDINLGAGINGIETAKKIREHQAYKRVPIIAVTAYTLESDVSEIKNGGCSHYIAKPFQSRQLKELITQVLNHG